jgi:hypothetical protein
MAGHAIALGAAPAPLRERFAAAMASEPLSDLAPGDRAELDALLARCAALEELPGRWQAALLAAESGAAAAGCCH